MNSVNKTVNININKNRENLSYKMLKHARNTIKIKIAILTKIIKFADICYNLKDFLII
jgi:hypothetical protein